MREIPLLAPCKVVHDSLLDSTLWILDSRYWILDSLSKEIGLRILTLSDPNSGLLELNFQDSGIQITLHPEVTLLQAPVWSGIRKRWYFLRTKRFPYNENLSPFCPFLLKHYLFFSRYTERGHDNPWKHDCKHCRSSDAVWRGLQIKYWTKKLSHFSWLVPTGLYPGVNNAKMT